MLPGELTVSQRYVSVTASCYKVAAGLLAGKLPPRILLAATCSTSTAAAGESTGLEWRDMTTLRESWEYGFDAAMAGQPCENANPWNVALHCAWLRGWHAGNQRRIELAEGRQITPAAFKWEDMSC
jgi:hypothetical protein